MHAFRCSIVALLLLAVPAAVHAQNCSLIVPSQPLTAEGLATPYLLTGDDPTVCSMQNFAEAGAYVEASILDLDTGEQYAYYPLVVDNGTLPLVAPVNVTLPANSIVGLWFGFNGDVLTLQDPSTGGSGLLNGRCTAGGGTSVYSPFGQFAYCNAEQYFAAANSLIKQGVITVPALGIAPDGQACPTVRDFSLVDNSPSDDVPSQYLLVDGRTAQYNNNTLRRYPNATLISNTASDDSLLIHYMLPALGCISSLWQVPDLSNNNQSVATVVTTQLQSALYAPHPQARVPAQDPMVLAAGGVTPDLGKLNQYRAGVNQVQLPGLQFANTTDFCLRLLKIGAARIYALRNYYSPVVDDDVLAGNLYEFLIVRFNSTIGPLPNGLGCVSLLSQSVQASWTSAAQAGDTANATASDGQNIALGTPLSQPAVTALIKWFEGSLQPSLPSVANPVTTLYDNVEETAAWTSS